MTYNKSEIMKKAWNLYRTGRYSSFADALRQSWSIAKAAVAAQKKIGWVKPQTLTVGDTIKVETLTGSMKSKVIVSIEAASLGFAGTTFILEDNSIKCFGNYSVVERVAVATQQRAA